MVLANQGLSITAINYLAEQSSGYLWMAISLPHDCFIVGDASFEQLRRRLGRHCSDWRDIYFAGVDLDTLEVNFHLSPNRRAHFRTNCDWQIPADLEDRLLRVISRAFWRLNCTDSYCDYDRDML
ncbi:hypothetical protein FWH13_01685 [Candidatus Saccharibacteria bacterium]|nr:hypothetical protein [Candidatus Saccharibacteria bacterium]